ncbi:hypothetical protein RI129_000080 [Pyrocoelia pectoralis]|uniref:valine--tRNA ligase n=1 Tax=Pyrocoelia pectoralis TaxID=417401 RepID=A0AAN7UY49_9COLE
MNGQNVIWYGGTDHAGIATQMLVEKMIAAKYNKSRHDITKDEFDAFFEQWKVEKSGNIQKQLEALGAGIDFDKAYFTLSPELKDFVQNSFIELFNRGLIYRASYMVNWSYYLQSTLSDIEIEHKLIRRSTMMKVPGCDEEFEVGVLHRFRYPIVPESAPASGPLSEFDEHLTIATTRLESVMGDVGLAVNPKDERYSKYIGRQAYNPFTGKRMPIIASPEVKMDFGTGVLKLTPAHCDIDAEICKKHGLPLDLTIIDEKGFIACDYEKFNGIHRYAAKKLVVEELKKLGLYEGVSDHPHWLPLCSRSGDIIEEKQVPQWFLNADDARYATEFVVNRDNLGDVSMQKWKEVELQDKNISLIPSGYRNTWRDWFSRYKDWCISRQITWGHDIPAYEVLDASGHALGWVAAKSEAEAKQLGQEKFSTSNVTVRKDNDVLDTWFSSALLPIAISKDVPLNLMETGHDILFFWVARMVLMSILLKNRLPFERILLHGMICDQNGKKMSKSKGNVIDPMHVINGSTLDQLIDSIKTSFEDGAISEKIFTGKLQEYLRNLPRGIEICGADVLRMSLLQSDFKDQKVNFDLQKALKKRVFVNKMHQTVRFLMMKFDQMDGNIELKLPEVEELNRMERWIYRRLADLIQET